MSTIYSETQVQASMTRLASVIDGVFRNLKDDELTVTNKDLCLVTAQIVETLADVHLYHLEYMKRLAFYIDEATKALRELDVRARNLTSRPPNNP